MNVKNILKLKYAWICESRPTTISLFPPQSLSCSFAAATRWEITFETTCSYFIFTIHTRYTPSWDWSYNTILVKLEWWTLLDLATNYACHTRLCFWTGVLVATTIVQSVIRGLGSQKMSSVQLNRDISMPSTGSLLVHVDSYCYLCAKHHVLSEEGRWIQSFFSCSSVVSSGVNDHETL